MATLVKKQCSFIFKVISNGHICLFFFLASNHLFPFVALFLLMPFLTTIITLGFLFELCNSLCMFLFVLCQNCLMCMARAWYASKKCLTISNPINCFMNVIPILFFQQPKCEIFNGSFYLTLHAFVWQGIQNFNCHSLIK